MKFWIEKSDLAVALAAIQPPPAPDDEEYGVEYEGYIRAEASGGVLRLRCQYGQAEAAARVEQAGVFFVEMRAFMQGTEFALEAEDVERIEIVASPRIVRANYFGFLLGTDFAVFDDPATAPESWRPPEPVEECDDGAAESDAEPLVLADE